MHHRAAIDSCELQRPCTTRTPVSYVPITPTRGAWGSAYGISPSRAYRALTRDARIASRGGRQRAPSWTVARSGGASAERLWAGSAPSLADPSSAVLTATLSLPDAEAAAAAGEAHPFWPALQPPFTYYASAEDAQSNATPSGLSPIWKMLLLSDGSVTRHLQLISGAPVTVECLSMRNVGWSLEGLPPGTELIPGPRVQRQVLLRCQPAPPAARTGLGVGVGPSDPGATSSASSGGVNGGEHIAGERGAAAAGGPRAEASSPSSPSPSSSSPSPPPALLPLVYASSWWNADTIDEYLRDKSKPIWVSLSQGHVELYREVHALFRGDSPPLEQLLGCTGPFWGRQYIFWSGGRPLTLIYEVFSPRLQQYLGPPDAAAAAAAEL